MRLVAVWLLGALDVVDTQSEQAMIKGLRDELVELVNLARYLWLTARGLPVSAGIIDGEKAVHNKRQTR